MSSINQFPFQDPILRRLLKGPGTPSEVAHAISEEGHAPGHDHDSEQLHRDVAQNIDHLVHLGLAEYTSGDGGRTVTLTPAGEEAARSLP
jgi:hypothetical protein